MISSSAKQDFVGSASGVSPSQTASFNSPAFLGLKTDSWPLRMSQFGKHAFKKNQFMEQESSGFYARAPNPTPPKISAAAHHQQRLARELHGVFPVTGSEPARPKAEPQSSRGRPSPRTNFQKTPVTQTGLLMTAQPNGVRSSNDVNPLQNVAQPPDLTQGFSTTYGRTYEDPRKQTMGNKINAQATQKVAGTGIYNPAIESPRPAGTSDPITNPTTRKEFAPHFVEFDRKILTFYGYHYDDNSFEPNTLGYPMNNNAIVRKVSVFYYLEDGSLGINEAKQENSGRPQGTFFRRAVAFHPDGTQFVPGDFRVGGNFNIGGITIYLVDANTVTREFYKRALGVEVPAALEYPGDDSNLAYLRAEHTTGLGGVRALSKLNRLGFNENNMKRTTIFAEAHHAQRTKEKRFLQHDGHVLRFNCVWKDPTPGGHELNFTLLYFLADDTIEVRTVKTRNSGYDDYPCLLRRQKLPQTFHLARTIPETNRRLGDEQFVTETNLRCGDYVDVFGRKLFIVSCDEFTREFYRTEYNIDQVDVTLEAPEEEVVQHEIPKIGDGFITFGSQEDSLKTVFGTKLAEKTASQIFLTRERYIRGYLKLVNDADREFTLTYNLENDELQLYELHQRNSGRVEGLYLRSQKYLNPLATDVPAGQKGRYFRANDFYIGAIIKMPTAETFEVLDIDEHSLVYMEENPKDYPLSDFKGQVAMTVINIIQQNGGNIDLRAEMAKNDPGQTGYFSGKEEMVQVLETLGIAQSLTKHEVNTIFRKFAERFKGTDPKPIGERRFCYLTFCDQLVQVHRREHGFKGPSKFPQSLAVNPLLLRHLIEINQCCWNNFAERAGEPVCF